MSEPTHVVRCPFCGHPYPMTEMQREVYRGRNMGCMNCGRPFKVPEPAPAPPPDEPPVVGEGAAPGPSDASQVFPHAASTPGADPAAAPAAAGAAGLTPGVTSETFTLSPQRNVPALASVACGILFFVLIAATAVTGWSLGSSPAGPGVDAQSSDRAVRLLTSLALGSAGLAVLLGIVGMFKARPPARAGKGYAIAGLSLGGGGLLVSGCLVAILLPSLNRQREQSNRDQCMANLQQISNALTNYANADPQKRYPRDLAALILNAQLTPDALVCLGSADTPAAGVTRGEQASALTTQPGHASYVYVANGKTFATVTVDSVVAYEPLGHHGDGIHVLYVDGTVSFVNKALVAQLTAELSSGQNPSPTATAAKQ